MQNKRNWIVRPAVPEPVYTDRQEFLDYFYNAALEAAHRRTMSTVLLGQRRMGKTEIFKRVVNRLFFEQDPKDPHAVVPVYFSFPDGPLDGRTFGTMYIENFLKYYAAFYTRDHLFINKKMTGKRLISAVEKAASKIPSKDLLDWVITTHKSIEEGDCILPQLYALDVPRTVSDELDSTIVMFLDEFQNTRLPQYDFDIAGFMQNAVESNTCPHFVTGSAMSILAREIIGRGSLFGRFRGHEIQAMSEYWGTQLVKKSAVYYKAEIPEVMAPAVSERCGGNPFYITAVVQQAAELNTAITDENKLNNILAVDISSGFIWGELNDQVNRWIERINDYKITKWILYLSALEENENKERRNELNLEQIQKTIKKQEGYEVSIDTIRDVLIKLSRGDLVEYLELGRWFRRVKDPILLEFLKVWGRIEVEGKSRDSVRDRMIEKYDTLKRRINEYKGYLAEVHMSQVLLNSQRTKLSGRFFNISGDIEIPWFVFVRHRMRLETGKGKEIDIYGAAGTEKWVCQSKWIKEKKTGIGVLKELKAQADEVLKENPARTVIMWMFAHNGLTAPALNFAKKHKILWSSRQELDELLEHVGLRPLPDMDE
ncbi:hypothetical protein QUF70_14835 [Desulfobacterales bacterium HSG17]|nr:hypothetical protein [Desulfobacterales bacterium HSG17]